MRLIDADALKEEFNNITSESALGDMQLVPIRSFISFIDNAPTVDIKDEIAGAYNEGYMCGSREAEKARPQGEWILYTGNGKKEYQCSICSIKETNPKIARFCYWCGAEMKGGAE